jgi:alpha,alpha-trehalase
LAPKGTNAQSRASNLTSAANSLRSGILDLLWDGNKLAFYDFHLSQNNRSSTFSAATFYPMWSGIIPPDVLGNATKAFGLFASLNLVMNRYNGTFPTTFLVSGQQWDAPNAWPPHQQIAIAALENLPANLTNGTLPAPASGQGSFSLIPAGQLGVSEDALPSQPLYGTVNASMSGAAADVNRLNGTVVNGGNATSGEGWGAVLRRELANRYFASALCSWRATGGSIPGFIPRLSDQELNVTASVNNTGNVRPRPLYC